MLDGTKSLDLETVIRQRLDGIPAYRIAEEAGVGRWIYNKFAVANQIEDKVRTLKRDQQRRMIEPLVAKSMTRKQIAEATGLSYSSVCALIVEFEIVWAVERETIPIDRRAVKTPRVEQFDLSLHDSDLTPAQKRARIEAWDVLFSRAIQRGYRDVNKGLEDGNMVIRATAKCGARTVFGLNDDISRCGGPDCPCGGRYRALVR